MFWGDLTRSARINTPLVKRPHRCRCPKFVGTVRAASHSGHGRGRRSIVKWPRGSPRWSWWRKNWAETSGTFWTVPPPQHASRGTDCHPPCVTDFVCITKSNVFGSLWPSKCYYYYNIIIIIILLLLLSLHYHIVVLFLLLLVFVRLAFPFILPREDNTLKKYWITSFMATLDMSWEWGSRSRCASAALRFQTFLEWTKKIADVLDWSPAGEYVYLYYYS